MRELKFRAWYESLGRMVFCPTLEYRKDGTVFSNSFDSYGKLVERPLMQYTGLHDANGVEIYEGDIVKEGDLIAVVEYHTEDVGSCGCCYTEFDGAGFAAFGRDKSNRVTGMSLGEDCEVIGNVHQNPELVNT